MASFLPFISEKFNGVIWRMEIDSLSETIVVEIRSSEEKNVSFASISLSTGKLNFKDLTTPERWLTGIEVAYDGVLLLHTYQSENSPVHKGLMAFDAANAENIWSNYTFAFDHLSVNGPVVHNLQIQPKKLFLADTKNGMMIRPYKPEIDFELNSLVVVPQLLPISYLPQAAEIEPYGNNIHYLEFNNFIIVSLHTLKTGKLEQHLYMMNDLGVVYADILNTDIQKIQPEAFILHKNQLIYIKNKSELKVLNL
jgi:hypothetical protein